MKVLFYPQYKLVLILQVKIVVRFLLQPKYINNLFKGLEYIDMWSIIETNIPLGWIYYNYYYVFTLKRATVWLLCLSYAVTRWTTDFIISLFPLHMLYLEMKNKMLF